MPTWNGTAVGMPEPDVVTPSVIWSSRILVTGASGFVGRRLVRALRSNVLTGTLLAAHGPGAAIDDDGSTALDLTDAAAVARVVHDFEPEAIVHLAAFSSVGLGAGNADQVWSSNFDATRAVAAAARALGRSRGVPVRLIFASTAEVYGTGFNDGPRTEDSPLAPASTYARSKAACEYLLRDMAGEGLDVTALRLFNHTGPGQAENFVVPALAAQLARLKPGGKGSIRVGNLDACRDFTDVEDVIDAYLAVLSRPPKTPGMSVYNVGSGRLLRVGAILDALIAHHAGTVEVIQDPARMRPSDVPETQGVFDAFATTYGWQPKRDFKQTIFDIYHHEVRRHNGS
ncbi:MAG: hypothetical protein DCF28_03870 [Alphaproteobacteria bacterium]|nr:MAG: hypothetical protein DCF28_03870 [Alphaproteobacteria bacterium]PZO40285.1 MAG: hypothetical protein DCE92_02665 [Alphaproteobacteria bacterium]